MAIDFPTSPTVGQVFIVGSVTYVWDGTKWTSSATNSPFSLGSASTPSITFIGDTNTGIYSPGADQVAISTNGTGRLLVDASGNLGVGTSSPATLLHLRATGTPILRIQDDDGTNQYSDFYNSAGQSIYNAVNGAGVKGAHIFLQAGTEAARITSDGKLGLGTSSPAGKLEVRDTTGYAPTLTFGSSSTQTWRSGGVELATAVANTAPYPVWLQARDNANASRNLLLNPLGGNVGVGTTSPGDLLHVMESSASAAAAPTASVAQFERNGACAITISSTNTTTGSVFFGDDASAAIGRVQFNHSDNSLQFWSSLERARIDSSGRLLVGTSTSRTTYGGNVATLFQIEDDARNGLSITTNEATTANRPSVVSLVRTRSASLGGTTLVNSGDKLGSISFEGTDGTGPKFAATIDAEVDGTPGANDMPGRLVFSTTADGASSPTERMRISQNGSVTIGITPSADSYLQVRTSQNITSYFDRTGNDGGVIAIRQDQVTEGTISVSGTTVSYNGAHLARWSQLPGGVERTEILRGSVLSNIDEMCEWGEENNEQLNRMKVSNIEGDRNVAGVFQAWDDDDDTYTNDFYCAMTGDFIIRIAQGVTVERGDLLMSAGDGTAKPQDDDIIRSKTIAKVTSTNVSCTYDDGSYCVPCVLMAC